MEMMFLGWTMKQLGAAKKHFSRVTGEDVDPTLAGAMHVKSWWQSRRMDEPLESGLVGCEPETDMVWACEVWKAGYR